MVAPEGAAATASSSEAAVLDGPLGAEMTKEGEGAAEFVVGLAADDTSVLAAAAERSQMAHTAEAMTSNASADIASHRHRSDLVEDGIGIDRGVVSTPESRARSRSRSRLATASADSGRSAGRLAIRRSMRTARSTGISGRT
jgi:hypothetical protein